MNTIDIVRVWRDDRLLCDIRGEVKRQATKGWRPWEFLLPPDLLWPMVSEVSEGTWAEWSPVLDGIGVQVGKPNEVSIRFVLAGMETSPVMVKTMPYAPWRKDDVIPIEVRNGNPV